MTPASPQLSRRLSARDRAVVTLVFLLGASLAATVFGILSLADFRDARRPSRALMLAANGTALQSLRLDFTQSREAWVPLASFPRSTLSLLRAREDKRARLHPGVDPLALASAAKDALTKGTRRGASTLAMQVARMAYPRLRELSPLARKSAVKKMSLPG